MRIMIVHSYYAPEIYGGAEYSVKKLAETLQEQGHIVRVICSGEKNILEKIDGVEVQRLKLKTLYRASDVGGAPRWKRLLSHIIGIWNLGNIGILDAAVKDFLPDVVHTNCLYGITPVIWKVAQQNSVRVVHTLRDYHLMCPLVALSCKITGGKKCTRSQIGCKLHRVMNRMHSSYVDCVTAPSRCTLDVLLNAHFFKKSEQVVIPNAIDFATEKVQELLEYRRIQLPIKNTIVFVYLGTLSEQKGIRWMLKAFQLLPKEIRSELIIAGKGELENIVKQACTTDPRVQYVGFLSEREVNQLMKKCDVLICPSLWDEPFGRVVLDAYKNGMPVISSDRGALPELVKNEMTGFIVRAEDVNLLSGAMMRFIDDRSLILSFGENALDELYKYSLSNQARAFERIYSGGK